MPTSRGSGRDEEARRSGDGAAGEFDEMLLPQGDATRAYWVSLVQKLKEWTRGAQVARAIVWRTNAAPRSSRSGCGQRAPWVQWVSRDSQDWINM